MRAVIYCRVSTKEQIQNLSLPTQLKACREYCRSHGYSVAREFIEQGESAKTVDRTELQKLLTFCRENKGRIHAFIVYNLSRFARDRYDHVVLRALLQKMGVTLRSVTEPIDDSSTGRLMEGVLAAFAQFDNDQKAERTETGMRAALQMGRWTFKAPLGYVNSRTKIGPSLAPDPIRAPLVQFAFNRVGDGHPVAGVLREIGAAGLRTNAGRALSLQSFRALLRNPILAGRIEVEKWGINRPADFEGLVGEVVFRRVQLRLSGKTEPITHNRDRDDFPLRRFLTCNRCTRPITGSWSTGRTNRYGYYHCPKCAGVRGRREAVESAFLDHLEGFRPAPEYLRLFKAIVLDVWQGQRSQARELTRLRDVRVRELKTRLERLEEVFIFERAIDISVYERQRDKLSEELAIAELELHDARIDDADVEGLLAFAEHLMSNLGTTWFQANLKQRQQIQRAVFPDGIPFDGRQFGTAPTCLMFNGLQGFSGAENGMASPPGFEPGFQP